MKRGWCETITHGDKRHGVSALFAALNTLTGKTIRKLGPVYIIFTLNPNLLIGPQQFPLKENAGLSQSK